MKTMRWCALALVITGGCTDGVRTAPPATTPTTRPISSSPKALAPAPVDAAAPQLPLARVAAREVAATYGNRCAVLEDGGVACWGADFGLPRRLRNVDDAVDVELYAGEVGVLRRDGTLRFVGTRAPGFAAMDDVKALARGVTHRCVIARDGKVRCAAVGSRTVDTIPAVRDAVSVSVGLSHACAATDEGAVWCWDHEHRRVQRVPNVSAASQVAIGSVVGCALATDRAVQCFSLEAITRPAKDMGHADRISVGDAGFGSAVPFLCRATGARAVCALFEPNNRQLALMEPYPEVVAEKRIERLEGEPAELCLVDEGGDVRCVGSNGLGELGMPSPTFIATPRRVPDVPPLVALDAGSSFACGIAKTGGVWCMSRGGPTEYEPLGKPKRLMVDGAYACAFDAEDHATCAYSSYEGLSKPARVPAFDGARHIALPRYADTIAVIGKNGEVSVGAPPNYDDLVGLTMTPVAGIRDARRVTRGEAEYRENVGYVSRLNVYDIQDRAWTIEIIDHVPAKSATRAPELDGASQSGLRYQLGAGGALTDHTTPPPLMLRSASKLVRAAGPWPCGLTASNEVICLERLPAREDDPDDRIVLRDVALFDATDEVYLTLDRDGVLSCFGNDTEGVCGPPGQGVESSEGPARVPLDGPLDGS